MTGIHTVMSQSRWKLSFVLICIFFHLQQKAVAQPSNKDSRLEPAVESPPSHPAASTVPQPENSPPQRAESSSPSDGKDPVPKPSPDPVFQKQTYPPPHPTLAEKKPIRKKVVTIEQSYAPVPPPKNVPQGKRPPPPDDEVIWVSGFWYWHNGQYVWIPGRWLHPRRGYVFIRPHWRRKGSVWVFLPGGWALVGTSRVLYPFNFHLYPRPWYRHHSYHHHHLGKHGTYRPRFQDRKRHHPTTRIRSRRTTRTTTRARKR